jgi:Tfp pilus assembly protein PilO
MSSSNRIIVAILGLAVLAVAFWMLALSPKRQEANDLARQAGELQVSLDEARTKAAEAETARRKFPADYRQLVVLGQAAPADDETSSMLVELNHIATTSGVKFDSILLDSSGEEAPAAPVAVPPPTTPSGSTSATPAAATVPPTEVAASVLPLGASIGPAGLAVMPYSLSFRGKFFQIADFISEIDSLVDTSEKKIVVDGRLMTLDGFALNADSELEFPHLNATFSVTTYLVPPSQGLTAGATEAAPASTEAAPVEETTETTSTEQ